MHKVVVIGAGTAGLAAVRALRFAPVEITLVERNAACRAPAQPNLTRVGTEALFLDVDRRRLVLSERAIGYDSLVVATGARAWYPQQSWSHWVRSSWTDRDTTAVVVGGGVAGVEWCGRAARAYRTGRVVLLEQGPRLLPDFPEHLAHHMARRLAKLDVEVRCGARVTDVDGEGVRTGRERVLSRAVVWAGGMRGAEFGRVLQREMDAPLDGRLRVLVDGHLNSPGHPDCFVIGDAAHVEHEGAALHGLATAASQQGRYVAGAIRDRLAGYDSRTFSYVDQGRFVLIGRAGVGLIGDTELTGTSAWLAAKVADQWSRPLSLRAYSAATGSAT